MIKSNKVFNGSKVFIALRTHLTHGEVENEHITLDFLGSYPEWDSVIHHCKRWANLLKMPVTVVPNGFANWQAESGLYHLVTLMKFKEYPNLTYQRNWHITLETKETPFQNMPGFVPALHAEEEIVDTLWVGYTDQEGNKKWVKWDGRQIPQEMATDNLRTGQIPVTQIPTPKEALGTKL